MKKKFNKNISLSLKSWEIQRLLTEKEVKSKKTSVIMSLYVIGKNKRPRTYYCEFNIVGIGSDISIVCLGTCKTLKIAESESIEKCRKALKQIFKK